MSRTHRWMMLPLWIIWVALSYQRTVCCGMEGQNRSDPSIIIFLGLPRSGSQQIHDFFECNGYRSAHYCCDRRTGDQNRTRFPCRDQTCGSCVHSNLLQNQAPFHNCSNPLDESVLVWSQFDLESQVPFSWFLPQHFALSALHRHYPNATYILNTRSSAQRWATNVLHWNTDTQRLLHAFGVPFHDPARLQNATAESTGSPPHATHVLQALQASLTRVGDLDAYARRWHALVQAYERHTQWVRDAPFSSGRLVQIQVDDPQAGHQLALAFEGTNADCWKFDGIALDNDWMDFSFQL